MLTATAAFRHDSIPAAMAAIYNMGKDSGLWDTMMRTDTELLTKKPLEKNAKNLDYFDLIVFASTTGELDMDDGQKKDVEQEEAIQADGPHEWSRNDRV